MTRIPRVQSARPRATMATMRVSEVWGRLAVAGGRRCDELLFFHRAGPGGRGKGTEGVTQQVGVEAGKKTQYVLVRLHGCGRAAGPWLGAMGRGPGPRLTS